MTFTITVTGLEELRARIATLRAALPEAMRSALDNTGTAVVGDLQQQAPAGGNDDATPPLGDGPGKLRDSFQSDVTEASLHATLIVSTTQPQKLAWVRYGRGPVYPVTKKALMWPGLPHPVRYAGPSQPNEFVEPVISQAPDFATAAFEEAVNAVLEG